MNDFKPIYTSKTAWAGFITILIGLIGLATGNEIALNADTVADAIVTLLGMFTIGARHAATKLTVL